MTYPKPARTIPEFCEAYGISRASYYNMPPEDRPREMLIGSKLKRITAEAEAEWRRRRERESERSE